ncbi:hypothetical protein DPMN_073897 [Dreissena polymorpha]|uniref:Uncharacterized protein n=1 Tax=Dreissena polymorpha TaxID=45954 RepID=A0A9D3YI46_DREPO|nr:hypothetical protein DPMN_073897 [Dreissena polymorpha]
MQGTSVPSERIFSTAGDPVSAHRACLDPGNCLQTKCGQTDGQWTKTDPKTSPEQSAIFQLAQYTNKTNILTKFHDDWAKIVTLRVFTMKTAPPTGGHVFKRTRTTFELNQHIIDTNILTNFELDRGIIGTSFLTKFHEDRTRNVASRVFTRKSAPPIGGHVFQRTGTTFELN